MLSPAEQATKLKKQVRKIEAKQACDTALYSEVGGYEINKAKSGLDGNLKALQHAESHLQCIIDCERDSDDKLAVTAGSKRDKLVAAANASLEYARTAYEQAISRHALAIRSAETDFETAALKYTSKLSQQRADAQRSVEKHRAAVEQSQANIARLEAKKIKPAIQAHYAKQPLMEELAKIEQVSKSAIDMMLAQIQEEYKVSGFDYYPDLFHGMPPEMLRDELESVRMRKAEYIKMAERRGEVWKAGWKPS